MFLYLKFLNFGVKTSFERSFIAFFDLKDRQNDIPKFHDRAVGDWELMTSTQDLISNVISLWEASICFAQISLFVSVCFCLCRRVSVAGSSENSSSESSNEESQASYHEEVEEKDNNVDVGAFDNGDHEAALDSL